jgi:hypothetical protein
MYACVAGVVGNCVDCVHQQRSLHSTLARFRECFLLVGSLHLHVPAVTSCFSAEMLGNIEHLIVCPALFGAWRFVLSLFALARNTVNAE